MSQPLTILYASAGGGWIHRAGAELMQLGHQAHLYSPERNSTNLPAANFHRCVSFAVACRPFWRVAKARYAELGYHLMFPIWTTWFKRQSHPKCDLVHAVMGSAVEPFDVADKTSAMKVLDASNSHPTTFYGYWQRELDLWNPSARVSVPRRVFARANSEIQRADVVLCASTYVRDSMLQNGVPEAKLAVNPFGVDLRVFVPRERLPDRPRFLFVGGLTLRKGLQYLLPAFDRIRTDYPNAELILCGQLQPDFEPLYKKWRPLFTHHTSLPHAELAALMQTCTAFTFPSIEEGFARVIAEAMGVGLPVIATHNSGATTVIEDGKHGLIVPACSTEHVYLAMRKLIEQPALCEALSRAAAAKMADDGSWPCYAHRLLNIYESHLQRK